MTFFSLRPEEKIKTTERKIMGLIETTAQAASENNMKIALERAREASSRERALIRLQEQAGLSDNHNIDLTFAVSSLNHYNSIILYYNYNEVFIMGETEYRNFNYQTIRFCNANKGTMNIRTEIEPKITQSDFYFICTNF